MGNPKVSIVTSTYNRATLVCEAIRSVQAQTFADWEMIVVDDGSPDNTREAVAQFSEPRVSYVRKDNGGLAAGRNTGIEQALGEYVAFLDDDDLYLPHHLAACMAFAQCRPEAGWLSTGYRVVDMGGKLLSEERPWQHASELDTATWLMECPTAPSAVIVKREWLDRVGAFDAQHGLYEDWDLWLRLSYAGCEMCWVETVGVVYRLHTSNMTHSSPARRKELGQFKGLDKFFAQPGLPPDMRRLRESAYARLWLWAAAADFNFGDNEAALDGVKRALEFDPAMDADQAREALKILLGYASTSRVAHPLEYAAKLIDHLPEPPFAVKHQRAQLLGRVASDVFFRAAAREDWPTVRRAFGWILKTDRTLLKNRGIWSILSKATFGPQTINRLRGGSAT